MDFEFFLPLSQYYCSCVNNTHIVQMQKTYISDCLMLFYVKCLHFVQNNFFQDNRKLYLLAIQMPVAEVPATDAGFGIQDVWRNNFQREFKHIRQVVKTHKFVAMVIYQLVVEKSF